MSETPADPSVQAPASQPVAPAEAPAEAAAPSPEPREKRSADVRSLLQAGAHFGHQTRRWNPQMGKHIFGQRNGIHIIDLDQTAPRLVYALEFVREIVAQGGKVLFVGTKRQASEPVRIESERSGQYFVNNRWLGGMLTNFRTVKKSIELFKDQLAILADEEKVAELSKKELSRLNRSVTKYRKSLDGIKEMSRLPDVMFVIDVSKEHIAISEARRLGIPIVAVVDTNCDPRGIDFVVPGNDDAIRAIELYCELMADACMEGAELFNERVTSEQPADGEAAPEVSTGRRVVEIRQQPQSGRRGRQAGGAHSATGRPRREAAPAEAEAEGEAPKTAAAAEAPAETPAETPAEAPAETAVEAPAEAPASETPNPEGAA
ncbi:MAG: 30S ribosomal protein S2 [Deltaproteobacteria bacterium]|jgi:small subunit ribosomal protein S2|nr:30S ribosomal protein S2 [Deltaproteobacteria bacterium]